MNNILAGSVEYPKKFSTQLKGLIHSLLKRNPFERLECMDGGIDEALRHEFFGGLNWKELLLNKKIEAPHKPSIPGNVEKMGKKDSVGIKHSGLQIYTNRVLEIE
jgi:hypothetical protein